MKKFEEFFNNHTKDKLLKTITKGKKWLKIQFHDLAKFDIDLANDLLENPEEVLREADIAIEQFDTLGDVKRIHTRFIGLPNSSLRNVWEIRSIDVEKFVGVKGIINKSSDIYHLCDWVLLQCKKCQKNTNVYMQNDEWKEPLYCKQCGERKPGWSVVRKEMFDSIKLGIIDDLIENRDRTIAREKIAILQKDLTSKKIDQQIRPGKKVIVNGFFKYRQKATNNQKSLEHELEFFANSIEFVKVGWETIPISKAEEEKIKGLAKQEDIVDKIAYSVTDVKGHSDVKLACLLLLTGAPHVYDREGQLASRGTIHVLLVGNPGTAKTFTAKRFGAISPISSFQSAATASGRGLVASVSQDKDIGGWVIYPGVVAMCHKGVVIIDEIDKTSPDDYGDHNNAMNDMIVAIAKASAKGRLETETSYLATANPENRVFTKYDSFYNQIDMPKDFLDRFDLIFPMENPTDIENRKQVVNVMLERHLSTDIKEKRDWKPEFNLDFIRKYIAYARRFNPNMASEIFPYVQKKLGELMSSKGAYSEEKRESELQHQVSVRHLESILRFAYASARLHLRNVTKQDIDRAFNLKRQSFLKLGIIDEHTGAFSWAKLENIDEEVVSDTEMMHKILKGFSDKMKLIPVDDIMLAAKEENIDEEKMEEYISKLKRKGDYYEPKRGFISKI